MASKRTRAAFEEDLQAHQSPYALYGTPLPPLDPSVRDDGSYMPIWKQEVTDDRGRKRLHGAFTGGFSAGYFNTVGSKEGWTPTTFVSSRQNRAKDAKPQQRAEDFMDDEDLREAEEARELQTSSDFAGFGSTDADTVRRAGLMDLLKTGGETMGVKLLKKMGWREGQGIGPKVRRRADLDDRAAQSEETYLFAPDNPPMIAFVQKNDHKGLGYEGEARLGESHGPRGKDSDEEDADPFFGRRLEAPGKQKPSKPEGPRRGAFGVGVLNDTGSDDEDPYSIGPQISYNRVIGGDKKKKKQKEKAGVGQAAGSASNPLVSTKPVFISKKAMAARNPGRFRKCHDGRLPLDGFILADLASLSISSQEKRYAPEVPSDWKSSKAPSQDRDTSKYVSTADAAKASSLDPTSRAALLGEAQLPSKSIFDWMTPEARERIAKLTGKTNLPPALGEKAPKGYEMSESQKRQDLWDLVPKLDKQLAVQALTRAVSGWMPYSEDPDKRVRYRSFIEVRAGLRDALPERVPGSTTDEWASELHEFARAAEVFKPVSGIMASRFTSASSGPKGSSDEAESSSDNPLLSKPVEKPEDPAVAAAKIGMFGPMTRSTISFYPGRLLCKRFNVKPPSNVQQDPEEQQQPRGPPFAAGERFQSAGHQAPAHTGPKELVSRDVLNQLMVDSGRAEMGTGTAREQVVVEPERNEALEAERPGEAVFKAIFGSDDEDEDEEMV